MTAALQIDITDDVAAPPRKSRRGSETRQRTEQVKMSFLPAERAVLEQIAADHAPENVHDFDTDVVGTDGYVIPGTQRDLVFWVFGGARDKVFDATRHLISLTRQPT